MRLKPLPTSSLKEDQTMEYLFLMILLALVVYFFIYTLSQINDNTGRIADKLESMTDSLSENLNRIADTLDAIYDEMEKDKKEQK